MHDPLSKTHPRDFINEQPGLMNQSRTCRWCRRIFQCVDILCPTKAHPTCKSKWSWLKPSEPEYDPEDFF